MMALLPTMAWSQSFDFDMTKPLPFDNGEFDLIFHPVSNCYVREVKPIWKECFRVLRPGGILLSGVDHYVNYIVDDEQTAIVNSLPFDPIASSSKRLMRVCNSHTRLKSR